MLKAAQNFQNAKGSQFDESNRARLGECIITMCAKQLFGNGLFGNGLFGTGPFDKGLDAVGDVSAAFNFLCAAFNVSS